VKQIKKIIITEAGNTIKRIGK